MIFRILFNGFLGLYFTCISVNPVVAQDQGVAEQIQGTLTEGGIIQFYQRFETALTSGEDFIPFMERNLHNDFIMEQFAVPDVSKHVFTTKQKFIEDNQHLLTMGFMVEYAKYTLDSIDIGEDGKYAVVKNSLVSRFSLLQPNKDNVFIRREAEESGSCEDLVVLTERGDIQLYKNKCGANVTFKK